MNKNKIKHIARSMIVIFFVFIGGLLFQKNYERNLNIEYKAYIESQSKEHSNFIHGEIFNNIGSLQSTGDLLSNILESSINNTSNKSISDVINVFNNINNSGNLLNHLYYIDNNTGNGLNSNGIVKLQDINTDLRNRDWYILAKKSRKPIISEVYEDTKTKKLCVTISYALHKNGDFIGVLSSDLFLDELNKYFASILNSNFSSSYLINSNGSLLMDSNKHLLGMNLDKINCKLKDTSKNKDEIQEYYSLWNMINNSNSSYIQLKNTKGENLVAFYTNIQDINYKLVVFLDNDYLAEKINENLMYTIFASFFIAAVLLIVVNHFISKSYKTSSLTGFNSRYKLLNDLKKKSSLNSVNILLISIKNVTNIKAEYGDTTVDLLIIKYSQIINNLFNTKGVIYSANENEFIVIFNSSDFEETLNFINNNLELLNYNEFIINESTYTIESFLSLIKLNDKELKDSNIILPKIENIVKKIKYSKKNFIYTDLESLIHENEDEECKLKYLQNAIKEDRLTPFFQPILNLKTEKIEKYEVLMRIKDDEKYLSPYPFIVLAEKYNLIEEIDLVILDKALSYKKQVDKDDKLLFSFNASGKVLNNFDYLNKANLIVNKYGIKHNNIVFEITETENIKNLNSFFKIINKFKNNNYQFSIDDFGTGYSSIYYLKNIPANFLKIDGSFIKDINEKQENLYVVKSIINMARAFNLKVIAEFVESEEILQTIKTLDVDFAQGYYISEPKSEIQNYLDIL